MASGCIDRRAAAACSRFCCRIQGHAAGKLRRSRRIGAALADDRTSVSASRDPWSDADVAIGQCADKLVHACRSQTITAAARARRALALDKRAFDHVVAGLADMR
jgi:hypothetical protein